MNGKMLIPFVVSLSNHEGINIPPYLIDRHSGMDDRQGWRKCGKQVGNLRRLPESRSQGWQLL